MEKNVIIGDGYTDYEIKKFGNANKFILFTENIFRKELKGAGMIKSQL